MKPKPKIAIVRGKFLNAYEMQFFEPLVDRFDITAFGSLYPYYDSFRFPVEKLPSPMDLPEFPFKMPVLNRIFTDAHYLYGLERKIAGFDIVHTAETYYHYTIQALNAKRRGLVKKVIATVLENIPFNNESIKGRSGFKKRSREELDHIIALTQKTRDALIIEGADPAKITVISHFIDTKKFYPLDKRFINQKDPNSLKILFTGRLEIYKGIYEVIGAFKNLVKDQDLKKYRLTLEVVGDGSQKARLIQYIYKLGINKYIKFNNVSYQKMPEIYQKVDIFVAPSSPTSSWQEQYNTALLEAQASGLAIVTTRTGGIPENVGDAAILVNPGDIGQITQAIKMFVINPGLRREYSQKARSRALKVHDTDIGSQKLSNLYNSLL